MSATRLTERDSKSDADNRRMVARRVAGIQGIKEFANFAGEGAQTMSLETLGEALEGKSLALKACVAGDLGERLGSLLEFLGFTLFACKPINRSGASVIATQGVRILDDTCSIIQLSQHSVLDFDADQADCLVREVSRMFPAAKGTAHLCYDAANGDTETLELGFDDLIVYGRRCLIWRVIERSLSLIRALDEEVCKVPVSHETLSLLRRAQGALALIRQILIGEFDSTLEEGFRWSSELGIKSAINSYCQVVTTVNETINLNARVLGRVKLSSQPHRRD